MQGYSGPEKRKHPRIEANFVVSYRVKDPSARYDLSQTKNISQGGILLITNQEFDKGTKLTIVIRFPLIPEKIEIDGAVIDSKEVVRKLIYETRIQFVNLNKEFFIKLGEFIKENLK